VLDPGRFERRIRATSGITLAVVFVFFGALAYWQVFRGDLADREGNPRLLQAYSDPGRGRILDRQGNVLAQSLPDGTREYSAGTLGHAVGYLSAQFGSQGAELAFARQLSGASRRSAEDAFNAEFRRTRVKGLDVRLTIDPVVQQAAAQALGNRRGAVVALDPRNGEILAMLSVPGYDPGAVDEALLSDASAPLVNRAAQGLYPPGSTFKTVTAISLLEHGVVDVDTIVECNEQVVIDGFPISCRNVVQGQGRYPFASAFTYSVNAIFAQKGVELGWDRLLETSRRLGFGSALDFDLDTSPTQVLPPGVEPSRVLLATTAFGQGDLLVTPLQMALVAAAVANDGVMPAPHLGLAAYDGERPVESLARGSGRRVMSSALAATMRELMVSVVREGQANVGSPGVTVGGKTGTAEAGEAGSHAWFIAFAPAEAPTIAVAVVVELGGQGGSVAAPIAGAVIRAAVSR
jgi:peptidoglycan glycosyltransferase